MERRTVLKQLILVAGAAVAFPACLNYDANTGLKFANFSISKEEELILVELSDLLIPETSTPGAKKLNLYQFVLKMVDDCSTISEQEQFSKGLSELNAWILKSYGSSLSNCNTNEKLGVMSFLEGTNHSADVGEFYGLYKKQLINGYVNSEYFMTKIVKYELIPGRYIVHHKVS